MLAAELAGSTKDGFGVAGSGGSAGVVANFQAIGPEFAICPPNPANRKEWNAKLRGNLREGLATRAAVDNVEPSLMRNSAGHCWAPSVWLLFQRMKRS
jgi:hypothetical protein